MELTDNEIIAEFMGFERIAPDKWMTRFTTGLLDPYFGQFRAVHMRFETSWDWLMPVVEKIVETKYVDFFLTISSLKSGSHASVYIGTASEEYGGEKGGSTIESVYKSCVDFIKWHNTQTK